MLIVPGCSSARPTKRTGARTQNKCVISNTIHSSVDLPRVLRELSLNETKRVSTSRFRLRAEIVENYGSSAHARAGISPSRDIFFKGTSSIDYAIKAGDGILPRGAITRLLHYIQTRFVDTSRTDELNYLGVRIRWWSRDSRKSPSAQITTR